MLAALLLDALLVCPVIPSLPTRAPAESQAPVADVAVVAGTSRAWALLACSVLFERNGLSHEWLGGAQRSAEAAADAK